MPGIGCIAQQRPALRYAIRPNCSVRANGGHPIALYPGRPLAKISLRPDPVLLFRYSTVTFNGHRIHYDRSYATST